MGSMSARRRAGACLLTVMLVTSGCIGGETTPAPVVPTPVAADGFTGSPGAEVGSPRPRDS
jgi:hypothetical protein